MRRQGPSKTVSTREMLKICLSRQATRCFLRSEVSCFSVSQLSGFFFRLEKICVEDVCENPCARIAPHLMVCDCPTIDPDTGFASEDRCQLCCYDFNLVSLV